MPKRVVAVVRSQLLLLLLLLLVGAVPAFTTSTPPLSSPSSRSSTKMSSSTEEPTACARNPSGGGKKHCVPCEGGIPALPHAEVEAAMPTLPLWQLKPQEQGKDTYLLSRSFVAKSFAAALAFLNEVGAVAEAEGHHPDLHLTSYRNVEVVLYTHSVSGLTENDLIMAHLIDQLPVSYSPKWLKEHPEAAVAAGAEGSTTTGAAPPAGEK